MRLILYSKPGCHLCEGLQEKLEQIQTLKFDLEIRDISTREDWFQQYQYEIPVLFLERDHKAQDTGQESRHSSSPPSLIPLPRPSPRLSVHQLERLLQKYLPPEPQK
ncbi:glutaredoxin family protein [Leptodesmis sp.]|uniref:glutaredoxin family protein n=1 Tax=Leptodesmis sp. TaxID=3100501 RepID=UPI00405354E7